MAGEIRVVYDDFSGGEYGHLGGTKAPDNTFTGRNVMVYRNGSIGPRPGMKAWPISIVPGGAVMEMWSSRGAPNTDLWWVLAGGTVQKCDLTTGTVTTIGALASAPTEHPAAAYTGLAKWVLTSPGEGTYRIDVAAGTVTRVSDVEGRTVAIVGERAFVGGGDDFFTVNYSDAGDFSTWPASNFFSVGRRAGISAMFAQADHLSILLADGSWWVYRGVGDSASLRKVASSDWFSWIIVPHAAEIMSDDEVVFMGPPGDWPIRFDGVSVVHDYQAGPLGDVSPYSGDTAIKVLRGRRDGEAVIALPPQDRLYYRRGGAWVLFDSTNLSHLAAEFGSGLSVWTDGIDFHSLDLRIDRMGFVSDTNARPGDLTDTPVNAHFTLPEWWSKPGTEVRVRQVVIDFVKFATGATAPSTNNITVGVECFGMFANDGEESPVTQTWSQENASATTAGVRDRAVFNIGEQGYGAGFQISLTALRGVAIRSVTAVLDSQPSTPRF